MSQVCLKIEFQHVYLHLRKLLNFILLSNTIHSIESSLLYLSEFSIRIKKAFARCHRINSLKKEIFIHFYQLTSGGGEKREKKEKDMNFNLFNFLINYRL